MKTSEATVESLKRTPGEDKLVDFDDITETYGIFGADSGFCYQHGFASENEANISLKSFQE